MKDFTYEFSLSVNGIKELYDLTYFTEIHLHGYWLCLIKELSNIEFPDKGPFYFPQCPMPVESLGTFFCISIVGVFYAYKKLTDG